MSLHVRYPIANVYRYSVRPAGASRTTIPVPFDVPPANPYSHEALTLAPETGSPVAMSVTVAVTWASRRLRVKLTHVVR